MPIVDEHQSGVRRYAVFTFVIDDQGCQPGCPALRFPHSPHASSLEVSTRLRHREAFFMKRLKSLEKGFQFPFVDITFFSSYQNLEEMKRLLEPSDCINFHDAAIHLQKGCYEEVQLVDPKRDMIQTPIDDDLDDLDHVSGSAASADTHTREVSRHSRPQQTVQPPGIQTGIDDYKKTRGYILIAYKTMEYMYSREFLSSWKTWTGVRYICMQIPRQLGLRRIAFYRQLSCTSDFSYVLLIEVTNLLLYAAQTLNLMDRIKLRLCGSAGIFREMDFQVDLVTANIHHIPTNYRPPEKPIVSTTIGKLDSADSVGSVGRAQRYRKSSQAVTTAVTTSITGTTETSSANVDSLMQLLKQKQEETARRKAAMESSLKRERRQSLAPPDYPAPLLPSGPSDAAAPVTISAPVSTPKPDEKERKETPKKAPTALPESDFSEGGNSSNSIDHATANMHRHLHQHHQPSPPRLINQNYLQQPMYHSTSPLYTYPVEITTAMSTSIPPAHPYFAHHYHHSGTLPLPILSHPADSIVQHGYPLEEIVANDYRPMYTYTGKPVTTSPFGYVQPTLDRSDMYSYNSPVYSRNEWKQESAVYGGHTAGEESIRNLVEKFRTLKETSIIGSDPYLLTSVNDFEESGVNADSNETAIIEDDGTPRRKRSHSAVLIEYPHQSGENSHDIRKNRYLASTVDRDRSRQSKMMNEDKIKRKLEEDDEDETVRRRFKETERLEQKLAEAEKLQKNIQETEKLQKQIAETERLQKQLAEKERLLHQQEQQLSVEENRLRQERKSRADHEEKGRHRQKSPTRTKGTVGTNDSPKSSPKRRLLPKLPTGADTAADEGTETAKRRHRSKEKRGEASISNEAGAESTGKGIEVNGDGKDTRKGHKDRGRSKDTTSMERKKKEKTQEDQQVAAVEKREQSQGPTDGRENGIKGKSEKMENRTEDSLDRKRRPSAATSAQKTETALAPTDPVESIDRRGKSRSKERNEGRSQSGGKEKQLSLLGLDGPSTSTGGVSQRGHTSTSPEKQAITRSRSGSRRRRQASRRIRK